MDWQLGQWVQCEQTQEIGQITACNGKTFCISIRDGITLYITSEGLENLGWQPISIRCKGES